MAAILIMPDGEIRSLKPQEKYARFSSMELGSMVGLRHKIIELPHQFMMFYNPDGDDMAQVYNETAANMLAKTFNRPELVYGPVVILAEEEVCWPCDSDWHW